MSISDLKELNDTYIEEKQLVHNKGQQRLLLLNLFFFGSKNLHIFY